MACRFLLFCAGPARPGRLTEVSDALPLVALAEGTQRRDYPRRVTSHRRHVCQRHMRPRRQRPFWWQLDGRNSHEHRLAAVLPSPHELLDRGQVVSLRPVEPGHMAESGTAPGLIAEHLLCCSLPTRRCQPLRTFPPDYGLCGGP